jgi:hypothetical protein
MLTAVTATVAPVAHAQSENLDPPPHVADVADRWYLDDVPQRVATSPAYVADRWYLDDVPQRAATPPAHDDWALQLNGIE